MKYSDIEPFLNIDAIEQQLTKLLIGGLPEEDRKTIEEFRKAVARKRAGKSECRTIF